MGWLIQNPIANMSGPSFLLFYTVLAAIAIALCRWRILTGDESSQQRPMLVPADIDPREIAYLRGGPAEVLRLMIFELAERGFLEIEETATGRLKRRKVIVNIQTPDGMDCSELPDLERHIVEWFATEQTPAAVFKSYLLGRTAKACAAYERRLNNEQLLVSDWYRVKARRTAIASGAALAALGLYKIIVALSHGFGKVGLIILVMVVAACFFLEVSVPPRLSRRGRDYLKRLRTAFGSARGVQFSESPATEGGNLALVVAGVFGFTTLAQTSARRTQAVFLASIVTGGCGRDCGSCNSDGGGCGSAGSGGSGCGGCGGGGH